MDRPASPLCFVIAFILVISVYSPSLAKSSGPPQDRVNTIIIHTVSGPQCKAEVIEYTGADGDAATWKQFFEEHPLLGIHYVIDREGTTLASVPENQIANHALGNNINSVGIELVHNGDGVEPFGEKQLAALAKLIIAIRRRHHIPLDKIRGHSDVDTRTFACGTQTVKSRPDPGANFPWERLRTMLSAPGQLGAER